MEAAKQPRRGFPPQQKYQSVRDVERCATIREGVAKDQLDDSVDRRRHRQREVVVTASWRNGRAVKPLAVNRLAAETRTLKASGVTQSGLITERQNERGVDAP